MRRWSCVRCGRCCERFIVPLKLGEALMLSKAYGSVVTVAGRTLYLVRSGGSCVFLTKRSGVAYCRAYRDRPRACAVYPFYIFEVPKYGDDRAAEFWSGGKKLYVYIDVECPGVDAGVTEARWAVVEAVSRWLGEGAVTQELIGVKPEVVYR